MKIMKPIKILPLIIFSALTLTITVHRACADGSGAKGGGDPLALEFKHTANIALKNLQKMKEPTLSAAKLNQLQEKIQSTQILVSDSPLPVEENGVTQNSAAENLPEQNLIIINRIAYLRILESALREALVLHEFLSLIQLESTANYPISSRYLMTYTHQNLFNATESIQGSLVSVSVKTPCPEPSSDAAELFFMIADPKTSSEEVKTFLKAHSIGWEVLDNQCDTAIADTIYSDRVDLFDLLYETDHLDPNTALPYSKESIYSLALSSGGIGINLTLELLASLFHQTLSLAPVTGKGDFYQYGPGTTPLMIAAAFNSDSRVVEERISKGDPVNGVDASGRSPLMRAATTNSNPEVVKLMIRAGANLHASNARGTDSLMFASWTNAHAEVVKTLIQAGLKVNAKDKAGSTALFYAAVGNPVVKSDNSEVIHALIDAGADVNAVQTKEGYTALMAASMRSHPCAEVLNALVQSGASIRAVTPAGMTALMLAASNRAPSVEVIESLLNSGSEVNKVDRSGLSALTYAIASDADEGVIRALIQAGANVNAITPSTGATELIWAVNRNTHPLVVQALIEAGASVNATDLSGNSALIFAAAPFAGEKTYTIPLHEEVITLLLRSNADPYLRNASGKTALDVAEFNHAPAEILKILGGNG